MSSPHRLRIFVAGATGNTGAPCVRALSASGQVDVVAMTRSASSAPARELSALPNVTVVEAAYTSPVSLERALVGCDRAYIACHNLSSHFHDETAFYSAAKQAGVSFVVKLATHQPFMYATSPVPYGRTHLALEDWLEKLELPFTSLRAHNFTDTPLFFAEFISQRHEYPATFKGHAMAMVSPVDVGETAAALLLLRDPSAHYKKRYVVAGPEDVTDEQMKALIEEVRGPSAPKLTSVEVNIGDIIEPAVRAMGYTDASIEAIYKSGPLFVHSDLSSLKRTPSDPAVLALHPPTRTVRDQIFSVQGKKVFATKQ